MPREHDRHLSSAASQMRSSFGRSSSACPAVCRGWRRTTSARDFLLAHHARQPSLPLLHELNNNTDDDDDGGGGYLDIMPLDHRAGATAADQLRSVARLDTDGAYTHVEACCDGLLILCAKESGWCLSDVDYYSVCNRTLLPASTGTLLPAGMYPHPPTGEYRLLMCTDALLEHERPEPEPDAGYGLYVYPLGSWKPPRAIGWPEAEKAIHTINSLLFRGDLHWFVPKDGRESCMIMVFVTIAELFRQMRTPAVPRAADLFVMDGVLGMASFNDGVTTVDIWTMQDYESEVWTFKYRVELPVAELTMRFGLPKYNSKLVVSYSDDGDVLILVKSGQWLLQIDVAGKLVASFHRKLLGITQFRFKPSLVPHTFFPTIEGYVVNYWPFISPDDYVVDT